MPLADIIFPAPSAVYVACLFFPVAAVLALATEFVVFNSFQRGVLSRFRLLAVVAGVNLFSWLLGVMLSLVLPSGLVPKLVNGGDHDIEILTQGPNWSTMAMASFFWACLLSFGLEYGTLRLVRKWIPFRNLALCTGIANVASYCVIAAIVAIHLHLDLL